jgi:hypothetical protein
MKTSLAILALLICAAFALDAQASDRLPPQEGGVLYGPHTSFFLTPPRDWVLDTQAGRESGLLAVYYPHGSSWRDGAVVGYAEIFEKTEQIQTVQRFVAATIDKMRAQDPDLVFFKTGDIVNSQAKRAATYHFFTTVNGQKVGQAVAYYDAPRTIDMVVLRGRNVEAFNAALKAFNELAGSYYFLTPNVHIDTP